MALKRWNGSAFVDATVARRWSGSAWVDVTFVRRWNGTNWVDVSFAGAGGLTVTTNKATVNGLVFIPSDPPLFTTVTSESVTATAENGTGAGPTIQWARVSGDAGISVNSPTAFTTTFTGYVGRDQTIEAVWKAVVTQGAETEEALITVRMQYISGL